MPKLKLYIGLDVSLKETSVAVIDENDKLVWRGRVASTPRGDCRRPEEARSAR
jgi:predicted NBD/HSP70 family sugar kinase